MSYQKIARQIQQGEVAPIYVFYGTETFLMQEMVAFMARNLIPEESREFNYVSYDLREIPIQQVIQDAETFPFMSDRKLVVANYAYFLTGARVKNGIDHDPDVLLQYTENPPPESILVLTIAQQKLDERKKVVKQLKKKGVMVAFDPLQGVELEKWLMKRAARYGSRLHPEAAAEMVMMAGTHLQMLDQELQKLSLYRGTGEEITVDDVQTMVSRSLEQDIFSLIDRIARVNIEEAFRILYDLLKNKEEPIKILSLIARQFRIILQVKILSEKGYSEKQMASQLQLHPYVVKIAYQQGRHMKETVLRRVLQVLAEEDVRMKTGQTDKVLALEMFLLRLKEWMVT